MTASRDIIIAGGMRTPFGDLGRSLKNTPMVDLGVHAARACLAEVGVNAADVDHLVCGNVLAVDQEGCFSGRVIALNTGMAEESRALNVNRDLLDTGERYAMISMCLGAGQGMATLIENVATIA